MHVCDAVVAMVSGVGHWATGPRVMPHPAGLPGSVRRHRLHQPHDRRPLRCHAASCTIQILQVQLQSLKRGPKQLQDASHGLKKLNCPIVGLPSKPNQIKLVIELEVQVSCANAFMSLSLRILHVAESQQGGNNVVIESDMLVLSSPQAFFKKYQRVTWQLTLSHRRPRRADADYNRLSSSTMAGRPDTFGDRQLD